MTDYKAKMHQIRFRLGLRPRHCWGAYSAPPQTPSWIWGPLRGRGGAGEKEGKGSGREGGGSGGEGKGRPQVTVEPGPLRALLLHWPSRASSNTSALILAIDHSQSLDHVCATVYTWWTCVPPYRLPRTVSPSANGASVFELSQARA